MATRGPFPPQLLKISGVIPLEQTLFTWQNLVLIVARSDLDLDLLRLYAGGRARQDRRDVAGIVYKDGR